MKTHRVRRGQIVEIPKEWRGKVTSRQTINKRQSKQPRKARRFTEASCAGRKNVKPKQPAGSRTRARRAAIESDMRDLDTST